MDQDDASYVCPSCGEEIVIPVDPSAGEEQEYVEDCPVCCRPVIIRVFRSGDALVVDAQAE
ncbi:MAG: CPXCG motif-containing cysteine-rich protein [Planctomycetota bacterium]